MRMVPPSPSFPTLKREKRKMTGGLPQSLCQSHDTLGLIDVCVGQSGSWSQGTGLLEKGKQPTFVLIVTLTQQGRKKERKRKKKGKENVLSWRGENPARKWDGCSNLPKTSLEAPLTP